MSRPGKRKASVGGGAPKKRPAKATKGGAAALVEVGARAPAFTLPGGDGKKHSLADYKGKCIVLYFYPRDHTPGCTQEACDFRDAHRAIARGGGIVLGISPDSPKIHADFTASLGLPFVLLSDEPSTAGSTAGCPSVCARYGVWQRKSMYGKSFMGIVRTTYLIDRAGRVARRWDRVSVRGHADEVIAALRALD